MPNINGLPEVISEEEMQNLLKQGFAKPFSTPNPDIANLQVIDSPPVKPKPLSFSERLMLSFGNERDRQQIKQFEESEGLRGSFDVGDIADIAGAALPLIGGIVGGGGGTILGTPVGGIAGAAIGVTAGEATRGFVGNIFRQLRPDLFAPKEQKGIIGETIEQAKEPVKAGVYTYIGGKVFEQVVKLPPVKAGIKYVTETLPERLYSSFFKTTYEDMALRARTGALVRLRENDPETFQRLINAGIVHLKGEGPEINPTLAKEALDKSFGKVFGKKATGGSLEKMAEYSYAKQLELELAARSVAQDATEQVVLKGDKVKYMQNLKELIDFYEPAAKQAVGEGFLNQQLSKARQLYLALKSSKNGKIDAKTALDLRRTLDNLRNASSFKQAAFSDAKIGLKQQVLKDNADALRGKIAEQIPGMKDVMHEYKFYINAADDLVKEAARRGNTKIFSLFDAIVGGSSIAAREVGTGIGMITALRTIQTPAILTWIARTLAGKQPITGAIGKTIEKATPFLAGKATEKVTEKLQEKPEEEINL